jgi:hypothetical protein
MSDAPRPIWLTREQRDLLARSNSHYGPGIAAAWDAAPADAEQAAINVLFHDPDDHTADENAQAREFVRPVLAALGRKGNDD